MKKVRLSRKESDQSSYLLSLERQALRHKTYDLLHLYCKYIIKPSQQQSPEALCHMFFPLLASSFEQICSDNLLFASTLAFRRHPAQDY